MSDYENKINQSSTNEMDKIDKSNYFSICSKQTEPSYASEHI